MPQSDERTFEMKRAHSSVVAMVVIAVVLCGAAPAFAQIPLGTAQNFAVLGGSTVTNTGPSAINGNLGVSPGSSVTGFPTGTLTLNFQGNPNAAFLFKIGSTLTTASASSVVLINNAGATCPPNVNWQVGCSSTLGTGSTFIGNILALTSITLTTGANVTGRALARNGAVTLDTNNVNSSACAAVGQQQIPALGSVALMMLMALLAGVGVFAIKRLTS